MEPSRALVMYDGVPLNSPFGGWVYWNRVPRVGIESVEIFNGATSDLYGSGALGGVINITTRTTPRRISTSRLRAGMSRRALCRSVREIVGDVRSWIGAPGVAHGWIRARAAGAAWRC